MIRTVEEAFRHLELSGRVASPRALKRAYRKAVMRWHPDRFPDPIQKMDAEAATYGVMAAYEFLKDLPADDARVYAEASPRWWQRHGAPSRGRAAGAGAAPAGGQRWLARQGPTVSNWRHEAEEPMGFVRAAFLSGLMALVVLVLVVVLSEQWNPEAKPAVAAGSGAGTNPPQRIVNPPRTLPPLKLASSLLEDRRVSTRRSREASTTRRAFGESRAAWEARRGTNRKAGSREDRELEQWSQEYQDKMRAVLTVR